MSGYGGALQYGLIEKYAVTSENAFFFLFFGTRILFLEFQIAVSGRLAVFLSINYTGIVTLRIIERGTPHCGGNNPPAHLRDLRKKKTLKMQRRQ